MTGFFPTGRDRGVTVAVDGFFAFVWFGWGQAAAPSWLVVPLAVGTGAGCAARGSGGCRGQTVGWPVAGRERPGGPAPVRRDRRPRIRAAWRRCSCFGSDWAVPVSCGVGLLWCGSPFLPLASALENPSLRPLGALLIVVAA